MSSCDGLRPSDSPADSTRLELQLAGQEKSRRSQHASPSSTEHLHEIAMR